jgi:hypothetical protein
LGKRFIGSYDARMKELIQTVLERIWKILSSQKSKVASRK